MKLEPEVVELDYQELESKLNRIEQMMGAAMAQPFRQLHHWYSVLLGLLRDKTISIQRLKKLLFGPSSERSSKVLPKSSNASTTATDQTASDESATQPSTTAESSTGESATAAVHSDRTSNILSQASDRPPIALFFTGAYHSAENLRDLLRKRDDQLPPPIQMCDALAANMPEDLRVILANCLTHGRRNFVEVVAAFPDEVAFVLMSLKKVYQTDTEARERQLSEEQSARDRGTAAVAEAAVRREESRTQFVR